MTSPSTLVRVLARSHGTCAMLAILAAVVGAADVLAQPYAVQEFQGPTGYDVRVRARRGTSIGAASAEITVVVGMR